MSTSQERFQYGAQPKSVFNITREKEKMRQTNFRVGDLKAGYESCYLKQFTAAPDALKNRVVVDK